MFAFTRAAVDMGSLHTNTTATKTETICHSWVSFLKSQPQASACVYHPSALITSSHHMWLIHCGYCSAIQALMLAQQLLVVTESSAQPHNTFLSVVDDTCRRNAAIRHCDWHDQHQGVAHMDNPSATPSFCSLRSPMHLKALGPAFST